MKTRIVMTIIFFSLFINCCKPDKNCHERIPFTNNSNKTLYINESDSIILSKYSGCPYSDSYKVLPNDENRSGLWNVGNGRGYCYDDATDTLRVFIFDEEVFLNYTWEEIVDNYMVLQRYDLTVQDLQNLDWQLAYPPSEAMKEMKMYPPYQE